MSGAGVEVRGGAAGVTAVGEDLLALARLHDETGDALRAAAVRAAAAAAEQAGPEALLGAGASPGTAARAAQGTAEALAACSRLALEAELLGALVREAVEAYRELDAALAAARGHGTDAAGAAVGALLPVLLAPVAVPAGGAWLAGEAGEAVLTAVGAEAAAERLGRVQDVAAGTAAALAERALLEHPGEVEALVDGSGGLLRGLGLWLPGPLRARLLQGAAPPRSYEEALDLIAPHLPDGRPVLRPGGATSPDDARPPASVADLLHGVARRQARDGTAVEGEIGVVLLTAPDGTRRWVVQLPGTETWGLPGERLRDATTNVHAAAGDRTAYAAGVALALQAHGVRPGEPVLLVGHSQGGMTAAALAADPAVAARATVTHVVTAGAPIGRTPVPPQVRVLALEHQADLVPRLDGRANPDLPHVTTVVWTGRADGLGAAHRLGGDGGPPGYAERSAALPDHPSVRAWSDSAAGFLDPRNRVATSTVALAREPG